MIKPGVEYLTQGKYKGEEITKVPDYYLEWMVRQPDMGEVLKNSARVELERRSNDPTIIRFGKHRGKAIKDISDYYLRWLANNPTMDVKWKNLAADELSRREKEEEDE